MPMSDSANKNAEVREQQVQGSLGYIVYLKQRVILTVWRQIPIIILM